MLLYGFAPKVLSVSRPFTLTAWWMLTEDLPARTPRDSRVGVEDTGRDLQLLSTSEIFDKFCLQRLQWSKKRAVPASKAVAASRCSWKPRPRTDKKRCSYKAINCLRCGVSLDGTAGRLASETTVKSLIDDLYVNGWKSWLPARTFVIYARFDRCRVCRELTRAITITRSGLYV